MGIFCRFPRTAHILWLFLVFGAPVFHLEAGTAIVTTTADNGPGSLRQALVDAAEGETIQFDTALQGQTIVLTSGELVISKGVTIDGPGPNLLRVSRQGSVFRIVHVMSGHTVLIRGLTITGGHASASSGGGIYNENAILTVVNCIISANVAAEGGSGGGVYNDVLGNLTIIDSAVSSNSVPFYSPNPIGVGGGIANGGMLLVKNSTISSNFAGIGGGGILTGGGNAATTVENSTVSNNASGANQDTGWGGGIYNAGMLLIVNTTFSGNSANGVSMGGGIYNDGSIDIAAVSIANSIFNTGVSGSNIANNLGTISSKGFNLSNDNGGGFLTANGDQINTEPMLGPLQDNGGPTFTHNLLTGSPAINAGDPKFTPPPVTDQRGYLRVFNGRIDVGSVEVQPVPTPSPTPTATATATMSPTATPTITQTPSATATPTATASPTPSPVQALNISTRLRVELGEGVMIGGFIVTGIAPKDVVVRGIGPSLAGSGISDPLVDPVLELRDGSGALLFQNNDWQDDAGQASQLIALGLAPSHPNESGIVATLQPTASYTAILAGNNNGTGVGLVEIYDVSQAANSQLGNISTRGFVQTGDKVMIGGFILGGGSANTSIAVRGIGPSLSKVGLNNLLADPTLELRDGNGALLVANDNWQDDPASAGQLSTHGLALQNSVESGIWTSLFPGAFTAILAGTNNGTGIGLVEIYNVQ